MVIWGSEIDDGQHKHYNMPYLIAAGEQIPIQRGKVIRFPLAFDSNDDNPGQVRQSPELTNPEGPVRSVNDLLRTVLYAVGVDSGPLGGAEYNAGMLDELLT